MDYKYREFKKKTHRLIPSRYPPVLLFDWVESPEELAELAQLEDLSNERIKSECGKIYLVPPEDWICGPGATPLMAAFTHPGISRFSNGMFGIYYAADSLATAIAETKFHRELFLRASNERPCLIQMREYTAYVKKALVDIDDTKYAHFFDPDIHTYPKSQKLGMQLKKQNEWGIFYPSARHPKSNCVAILRPPALSIPTQGCHLDYIWDGTSIAEIRLAKALNSISLSQNTSNSGKRHK